MNQAITSHPHTLVLVTRPDGQRLAQSLGEAGLDSLMQPGLRLVCQATLEGMAGALLPADWYVFVSPRAVTCCGKYLASLALPGRFAAVGTATARALAHQGIEDIVIASSGGGDGLLANPAFAVNPEHTVAIVCAEGGREILADTLRERGAKVREYHAYRRETPAPDLGTLARLEQHEGPIILTATSLKILENIDAMLSQHIRADFRSWPLVVLSERIRARADELGFQEIHSTLTTTELALRDKVIAVASAAPAR